MQNEIPDAPSEPIDYQPRSVLTNLDHGLLQLEAPATLPFTHYDERGRHQASGSEWSLSSSSGRSPTESQDAWLDSVENVVLDRDIVNDNHYKNEFASRRAQVLTGGRPRRVGRPPSDQSLLLNFPEGSLVLSKPYVLR